MRLVFWLLVAHGIICLLGAFFPFYPPVFLFYWFFPGPFVIKLIIVLLVGAAQVVFGTYWAVNRWRIRWYWLTTAVIIVVALLLVFPVNEGLFS
jgi:hypothetical protein